MRKIQILLVAFILIIAAFFVVAHIKKIEGKSEIIDSQNKSSQNKTAPLEAVSFVSPHHLVAEKIIDDIFAKVAKKDENSLVERIIVVSPNHFNLGSGWAITSDANLDTEQGVIRGDKEFVNMLSNGGLVHKENSAFQREHGIYNLLPYVKKYFPQALIVPLMVRDGFPVDKVDELAKTLAQNSNEKTLLILSADFSHYLEKNISHLHDEQAIDVLSNLDLARSSKLDIDCVPGLQLLMKFSALRGFEKFTLEKNSNSSEVLGQNFIGENTSYVTGYYEKGEKKAPASMSFMFFGDLMLDRDVRSLIGRKSTDFITEKIQRLFWSQDLNVANLEGPITNADSVSVGTTPADNGHFSFTFDPQNAKDFLTHNNIKVVNIGNNHILNFKQTGLEETKNILNADDVNYFGNPLDKNNYLIKNINEKQIAFVNYNQFSSISAEDVVNSVSELKKKNNLVIVYAHWGTEYELQKTENQKEKAHLFIDAGADMVIGSHPHVVEPLEIYKNKIIFYSLGNFVFDQYFSEDTKTMLAVRMSIRDNSWKIVLEPLYQDRNGQIVLAPEEKRKALLERLAQDSEVDYNMKQDIKEGQLIITQ
jgi:poly-gamma-glutamate synthesis protein (capsule biosynthesis protein)